MPASKYAEKLISPLAVRFTQDQVELRFRDSRLLETTFLEIKPAWQADAADGGAYDVVLLAPFPAIEVFRWKPQASRQAPPDDADRHWFTFDNRRLYCLQRAAVDLWPYRVATIVEALYDVGDPSEAWQKYRSTSQGQTLSLGPTGVTWHWTEALAVALGPKRLESPGEADQAALRAVALDDSRESAQELEAAPAGDALGVPGREAEVREGGTAYTVVRPTLVQAGLKLSTGSIGQLQADDEVEVLEVHEVVADRRLRGKILFAPSSTGFGWISLLSTEDGEVWATANDGTEPAPIATVEPDPSERGPSPGAARAGLGFLGHAHGGCGGAAAPSDHKWPAERGPPEEPDEEPRPAAGDERPPAAGGAAAKWAAHREGRIARAKAALEGLWQGDKGETYSVALEERNSKTSWTCTRSSPDGITKKFTLAYDRGLVWWGLAKSVMSAPQYFTDPADVEGTAAGEVRWYAFAEDGRKDSKPRFTWRRPSGWSAAERRKDGAKGQAGHEVGPQQGPEDKKDARAGAWQEKPWQQEGPWRQEPWREKPWQREEPWRGSGGRRGGAARGAAGAMGGPAWRAKGQDRWEAAKAESPEALRPPAAAGGRQAGFVWRPVIPAPAPPASAPPAPAKAVSLATQGARQSKMVWRPTVR